LGSSRDVAGVEVVSAVTLWGATGFLAEGKTHNVRGQENEVEGVGGCSGHELLNDPTLKCSLDLGVGHLASGRRDGTGFVVRDGMGLQTATMLDFGCAGASNDMPV